ncbi:NACHT and WD domain-containing protein [Verticillium dahliae]|nr:NACHT and WD domain-containing protein [Verticillium dahliae]
MERIKNEESTQKARRAFTLRSVARRDTTTRSDGGGGKGPIGLTTLFEPSVPGIADLIFVHGLNGGSYSTWTQDDDPDKFWPAKWLPHDEAFQDARIHTFGYNSSWAQESVLNIQDFASSLLLSLKDCPTIPREEWAPPLIFVGHSMGGLVVKKAFLLSKQKQDFASISQRVNSVYFLATPHHGSDMAEVLARVFAMAGERPFVKELTRNSPTIQAINNEFPEQANEIRLFSFFETKPMSYGIGKSLVVEKQMAQLNYANETTDYLDANHRDVARFSSKLDSSYIKIRNSLAKTIESLRRGRHVARQRRVDDQRQIVEAFLGVTGSPETTLSEIARSYLDGSLSWFLEKPTYSQWTKDPNTSTLWVQGKPGAGKTILSSLVIRERRASLTGQDCCFYFFVHSDVQQCTISAFLLSLAWQLATSNEDVMSAVCDAASLWKGHKPGTVDHRSIWHRLFLDRIFKTKPRRTYHLVVDGLDECKNPSELVDLLFRAQELWPFSIFITSRANFGVAHPLEAQSHVISEHLQDAEIEEGISRFIQLNLNSIPDTSHEAREKTGRTILAKSSGCFLWVKLVFTQLQQADSKADAQRIIDSVPPGMDALYRRILVSMAGDQHSQPLAKAILKWAAYSSRPLRIEELQSALEIDINDEIPHMERVVSRRCGHLVYFDSKMRLQPLHATVKEFLTDPTIVSDFVTQRNTAHKSLALTCLKYLSGNALRPMKFRRSSADQTQSMALMDYASTAVFDHIAKSGEYASELIQPLAAFLASSNVLAWIEYLASQSRLGRLLQAGKTISRLLKQNDLTSITGLSKDTKTLEGWETDLVRLVSKFGRQLRARPSAIRSQIPPLCPDDSIIHQQFVSTRDLHIVGISNTAWDDCASVINQRRGETITAVASSTRFLVTGTMLGREAIIYDESTYQEIRRLNIEEPPMIISMSSKEKYLATAGPKSVKIWSVASWTLLTCIPTPVRCLSLAFIEEDELLAIAMTNNQFVFWDIQADEMVDGARWTDAEESREAYDRRWPVMAATSASQCLMAIVYRSQDLLVWNFEERRLHDIYNRECGSRLNASSTVPMRKSTILCLAFSASQTSNALVAGYFDGELVLYDTRLGIVRNTVPAVNALCMTSSHDGRTLATGDAEGTIQIFNLENIHRLYRITFNAEFIGVRALAFTGDDLRLLDIRGKQCRVWEPRALLRQEVDDDDSDTLSLSTATHEVEFTGAMDMIYITCIAVMEHGQYILCGKDDGSVQIYECAKGETLQTLFTHKTAVKHIKFDEVSNTIVSLDQSGTLACYQLVMLNRSKWRIVDIFDEHVEGAVDQILTNRGLSRLLVSSGERHVLFSVDKALHKGTISRAFKTTSVSGHTWSTHPTSDDHVVLFSAGRAFSFSWNDLKLCENALEDLPLLEDLEPEYGMILQDIMTNADRIRVARLPGSPYFTTHCEAQRQLARDAVEILLWDGNRLGKATGPGPSPALDSRREFAALSDKVDHIIGTYQRRLIFLHLDGWVWSVPLENLDVESATHHFFIPADWLSLNNRPELWVTSLGDIIFPKGSELVIVKRGLELERPSPFPVRPGSDSRLLSSSRGLVSRGQLSSIGSTRNPQRRTSVPDPSGPPGHGSRKHSM